jgi:hypothetical protein
MKLPDEHIAEVCKMGEGEKCCRYLVGGAKGLECMKTDPLNKSVIDKAWATDVHVSQGDNCGGWKETD